MRGHQNFHSDVRKGDKSPGARVIATSVTLTSAILLALGMGTPVSAANFIVRSANDSGPETLRQAALDANAATGPHAIFFVLPPSTTIDLTSGDIEFTGPDVTIQGPGQDVLTISGSHTSRIFDVQAGNLTVKDLTLRDGLAQGDGSNFNDQVGGAIRVGPLAPPIASAQFPARRAAVYPQARTKVGTRRRAPGRADRSAELRSLLKSMSLPATQAPLTLGLTLDHVKLLDNRADAPVAAAGGAVFTSGGATLVLRNSVISGNSASALGGAICALGADDFSGGMVGAGSFDITDSSFMANHIDQNGEDPTTAGQGGAILTFGPGGNITRSVFSNNVINDSPPEQDFSEGLGGALELIPGDVPIKIVDSEISGNTIVLRAGAYSEGAGLYCVNFYGGVTPVTLTNTTISGNQSEYGAAIEAACNLQLVNSTIAGNFSPNTSGLGDAVELVNSGVFNAESTLIYNPDANVDLFLFEGANELGTVSKSLIFAPDLGTPPLPPDTIIGVDPLLAALTNNGGPTRTQALLPGSPAIDAGSNPQALSNDQRGPGFGRVVGAAADIGAYEFDSDRIFTNGFE